MRPRLLVVTSHPIQYQAPWFRALQRDPRVDLTVLFLALPDARDQGVESLLIMCDREGNIGAPDAAARKKTVEMRSVTLISSSGFPSTINRLAS